MKNNVTVIRTLLKSEYEGIDELLKDYRKFINILTILNQSLNDAKIEVQYWETYIEALTWKFSIQSATLADVLEKTSIDFIDNNAKILDYSSTTLLSRSLIENYLVFYYLYIMPKTEKEVEFRVKLYEISGLSSRQKITPTTSKSIKQSLNEKEQIEQLIDEIKTTSFFNKLDSKIQKSILSKKPAKLFSWGELFDNSPLTGAIFKNLWNIYSNHAHSEFISILQNQDFYKNYSESEVITQQRIIIRSQIPLLCIYILDFIKKYKAAEIVFNTLPTNTIEEIRAWQYIGIYI